MAGYPPGYVMPAAGTRNVPGPSSSGDARDQVGNLPFQVILSCDTFCVIVLVSDLITS